MTVTITLFQECSKLQVTNEWPNGFNGRLPFTMDHDTGGSWTIFLSFDGKLDQFTVYQGQVSTSDWRNFEVDNFNWDGDLDNGDSFTIEMLGLFSNGGRPKMISARIDNEDICN